MKPLLLLHGAIGSKEQFAPLQNALSSGNTVFTINFPGHGGSPLAADFSIEHFANDVLRWMEEMKLEKISIFGYSMGGYVALFLAKNYPEKVEAVVTLGTKLHWDATIAAREIKMLQPNIIEQKLPAFAKELEERHQPEDWREVLNKTAMMLEKLGNDDVLPLQDFQQINCPVLLMLGDRDKMVTLEETVRVFKKFANAQLAVLPNTPHPIEQVDTELLAFHIRKFIGD
jgi:pimeloyl-ACP methyl ester carboxylesterase